MVRLCHTVNSVLSAPWVGTGESCMYSTDLVKHEDADDGMLRCVRNGGDGGGCLQGLMNRRCIRIRRSVRPFWVMDIVYDEGVNAGGGRGVDDEEGGCV